MYLPDVSIWTKVYSTGSHCLTRLLALPRNKHVLGFLYMGTRAARARFFKAGLR